MIRFIGCMVMGLAVYLVIFLVALLWDFSWFKKLDWDRLVELWQISTGQEGR